MPETELDGSFIIMKPFYMLLWIFFIYLLIFIFVPYHYNDPDSFHFLSLTEHKVNISNGLFEKICYNFGLNNAKIFLLGLMLLGSLIIYDICSHSFDKEKAWIFAGLYLFTPLSFIFNGWFGRLDKNVIEMLLFTIFMIIQINFYMRKDLDEYLNVLGRMIRLSWQYFYFIGLGFFLLIAASLWEGWKVFILIAILYDVIYFVAQAYIDKKLSKMQALFYSTLFFSSMFTSAFIYKKFYMTSFSMINETALPIVILFIPEFVVLFTLIFYEIVNNRDKNLDRLGFYLLSFIVIVSCMYLPRLVVFVVPLFCIIMAMSWDHIESILKLLVSISLITMLFTSTIFMMKENYKDIRTYDPGCGNEMLLISDWSYGHIYEYYYDCQIKYKAHPTDIREELDYLYYLNKSCTDCILLYHPDDWDRFEMYRKELDLPKSEILKPTKMIWSYRRE